MLPYYEKDGQAIWHGDNVATMRNVIPDGAIDLVVTSPPYDNLRTYGGHQWDFEGVAAELWRVIKPGGVVVWVVADATIDGSETGTSFRQALRFMEIGFRLNDTMIWNKGCFAAVGSLESRYAPVSEFMFVFSCGKARTFNAIKDRKNIHAGKSIGGTVLTADRTAKPFSTQGNILGEYGQRFNIWDIDPQRGSDHPAPFPEALARDHILSWSNEGDIVLDPFNGSGTTTKMAQLMGRRGIGIEVNEEYCEIGVNRLRQRVLAFQD
jgi:DNA modification methylase